MNKLKQELYNLIQSEATIFDFIQEHTLDGLLYWNMENLSEGWINDKFWTTLGYDPEEMADQPTAWRQLINPDDLELASINFKKHFENPEHSIEQIVRYTHKSGQILWIKIKGIAIRNKAGQPTRMLGVHINVTEEKRTELLLTETNRVAKVGSWEVNLSTGVVYWSDVTKEIHEVAPDFVPNVETGINFYKEGESRETITLCLEKAIADGTPWDVELQLVTATGKDIWVRAIGETEFFEGKCVRLFGVFQDIDERVKAAQKHAKNVLHLRESEERFRQMFENAPIGIGLVGLEGDWQRVNQSFLKITGYTFAELQERDFRSLSHPDDLDKSVVFAQKIKAGKIDDYQLEKRYLHKNGHYIWVILAVSAVRDKNGTPIYFIVQLTDISEKKKVNQLVDKERAFLQTLIDNLPVNVYVKDRESRKTLINKRELEHMGVTDVNEVLGKSDHDLYPRWSADISRKEDLEVFETGKGFVDLETINEKKNGEKNWFLTSKIPIRDNEEGGEVTRLLGISYNITKYKKAEEKLRQLSILESKSKEMEQFAYVASHDLREPLLTIRGYTELLDEDFSEDWDEDAKSVLVFIQNAVNRMDALIHGLLDYSRLSQVKQLSAVKLDDVLQDVQEDLAAVIHSNDALIIVEKMPIVKGYPLEIKLLFQNLISNAIKFKKEGISPKIEISGKKIDKGWQFLVKDNGIGMEKRNLEKIFNIFSRLHSKEKYPGTGIGLANCKKIAELHNGQIWVESVPNEGSSFYFTILTDI